MYGELQDNWDQNPEPSFSVPESFPVKATGQNYRMCDCFNCVGFLCLVSLLGTD